MVSNPLTDPEWATRTVDLIDRVVGTIRRYTTQPLVKVARGIVFGLLGTFGLVAVLTLVTIALTRGIQSALDAAVSHATAVWLSYFILSLLCALGGAAIMRRRYTDDQSQ